MTPTSLRYVGVIPLRLGLSAKRNIRRRGIAIGEKSVPDTYKQLVEAKRKQEKHSQAVYKAALVASAKTRNERK